MSSPNGGQAASDLSEVEAVLRNYIEGWYEGDAERMDRALHDDLVKRIPVVDDQGESGLRRVTKQRMVDMTAEGGGKMTDPAYEISVDEVAGDIATARLLSPEYLDFVHLAKTTDGWKMVNVLFHLRD